VEFNVVIGCCWFLPEDIGPLLALLKLRPEIDAIWKQGGIDIQRFNPSEFPMTAYDRVLYDHFSVASMRFAQRMSRKSLVVTTIAEPMCNAGFAGGNLIPVSAEDLKSAAVRLFSGAVRAFCEACPKVAQGRPRHLVAFAGSYLVTGSAKAARHMLYTQSDADIIFHTRHGSFDESVAFVDDLARYRHEFGRIKVVIGTECRPGGKYHMADPGRFERLRELCLRLDMDVQAFDAAEVYRLALADILTYAVRRELTAQGVIPKGTA